MKRSVDAILRQKRQRGVADNIPNVMIDPAIVSQIMNTSLPNLTNASLTNSEWIKNNDLLLYHIGSHFLLK